METRTYEYTIVGSGAGGATLARELSKKGRKVLVLERGKYERKIGTAASTLRYYDLNKWTKMPSKSKEGVILLRSFMAGGSTVVSLGNGARCLEKELSRFGITLENEFTEAEQEMHLSPIDKRLLSKASEKIMWASNELGYKMEPMPKVINPKKCRKCGNCGFGCIHGAKWTALDYLDDAVEHGAQIMYNVNAEQVVVENGKAKGIRCRGPHGRFEILSDVIVLSAGGLSTPVILQKSGIRDAGTGLFIDLLVNTYGVTDNLNQLHEPPMTLVNHEFLKTRGFLLSPYVALSRMFRIVELGAKGIFLPVQRLIGIMTKIIDEPAGRVYADGTVSKPVTDRDRARLQEGSAISGKILEKAGADGKSIVVTKPQGSHPGGTAAIGKIVDKNLQTEVKNLFVCDASVLPESPGLPPILTIVALAKRLAKVLTSSNL